MKRKAKCFKGMNVFGKLPFNKTAENRTTASDNILNGDSSFGSKYSTINDISDKKKAVRPKKKPVNDSIFSKYKLDKRKSAS